MITASALVVSAQALVGPSQTVVVPAKAVLDPVLVEPPLPMNYLTYGVNGAIPIPGDTAGTALTDALQSISIANGGDLRLDARLLPGDYTINETVVLEDKVRLICERGVVFRPGAGLSEPYFDLAGERSAIVGGEFQGNSLNSATMILVTGDSATVKDVQLSTSAAAATMISIEGDSAKIEDVALEATAATTMLGITGDFVTVREVSFVTPSPDLVTNCIRVLGQSPTVRVRGTKIESCTFKTETLFFGVGVVDMILARWTESLLIHECTFTSILAGSYGNLGRAIALEDATFCSITDNYFRWLTINGQALVHMGLPSSQPTTEGHHSTYNDNLHENINARYCLLLEAANFDTVDGNSWGRVFVPCGQSPCDGAVIKTRKVPGTEFDPDCPTAISLSITNNSFHALSTSGLKAIDLEHVKFVNIQGVTHTRMGGSVSQSEVSILVRESAKQVLIGEDETCLFARPSNCFADPNGTMVPVCWENLASKYTVANVGSCPALPAAWINELHYANTGTDTGEFVEIAGPAGTTLTGWKVYAYDGGSGSVYATFPLTGVVSVQQNGFGALSFPTPGLEDGPDGLALVDALGTLVEFISYEGSFLATSGPAMNVMSTDIGVDEPDSTPVGQSLQLVGMGSSSGDFSWQAPAVESPAAPNTGQVFQ